MKTCTSNSLQLFLFELEQKIEENCEEGYKVCVYCDLKKSLSCFPKHIGHKDNLDSRCKDCIKKQSKIRAELHKTAPPKPNVCECCGNIPKKHMALDHDHETNEFRGWLCEQCNVGIGSLGDNLEGVLKAVAYLQSKCKNESI